MIDGWDRANEARSVFSRPSAELKDVRTVEQNIFLSTELRAEYRFAIFVLNV